MTTKTKKVRTVSTPTARMVFATFRKAFLKLDHIEQRKVWDVLVALRGCDADNNDTLKEGSTAIIRAAVFGPTAGEIVRAHSFVKFADNEEYVEARRSVRIGDGPDQTPHHFYNHVKDAFTVLGLSWETDNGAIAEY